MRKTLKLTMLILILLTFMAFASTAYAGENSAPCVKVWVENNDIQFDAKPFIDENNRTLIPVRFVSEALGAEVEWNQEKQEVTIKDNDKIINLSIGSNNIFINGEMQKMDTKAIIKEDRTFVPLRFVSEALNCDVAWDQEYYVAKVNRNTTVEETEILTVMSKRFPNGIERLNAYVNGIITYKDSYCRFSVHNNLSGSIKNIEIYYFPYEGQEKTANEMLMYALSYLYPFDYEKVYEDAIDYAKVKKESSFKNVTYKDRHTFLDTSPGNYGVLVKAYEKGYVNPY